MQKKINFLKESLKSFNTSGTLVPSSQFLAKKMLKGIDFKSVNTIVELGPGNGVFTKKILEKLHPDAVLICFEINSIFYEELALLKNPQMILLKTSAENIMVELKKLGILNVDCIISSLPLTMLHNELCEKILNNAYQSLAERGSFIQYQYSLRYHKKLNQIFNRHILLDFELLNFPPAFIYRCKKIT